VCGVEVRIDGCKGLAAARAHQPQTLIEAIPQCSEQVGAPFVEVEVDDIPLPRKQKARPCRAALEDCRVRHDAHSDVAGA
jgi:hypothetical protein